MIAVIKTGGKQYRVAPDQLLKVESIVANEGDVVDFNEVLMISGDTIKLGKPFIEGANVKAEVVRHGRARKINILKFKRRKHHMKRQGHRQNFTEVKITEIKG